VKTLAVLEADFRRTPLGTRSRLAEPLAGGEPPLRRTVRRLLRCTTLAGIHVAVPPDQRSIAEQTLAGLDAAVETHDAPPMPWAAPALTGGRCAAARKWSLDAWAGGLCGFAAMDEYANLLVLDALARREHADAVVSVPPAAPLLDPLQVDAMVRHLEAIRENMRLTYAQAPPGLLAPVFLAPMIADVCRSGWHLGRILAYRPDDPQRELHIRDCCYRPGPAVEHAWGRLIADTDRAFARVETLLREPDLAEADAAAICRWLSTHDRWNPGPAPREVEIELTTDDALPETTLRPRGTAVGRRGPIAISQLDRLFEELARTDDSLIVFGGFGEPLRHPDFPEILRRARHAGIYGIALRTTALDLDADRIAAILDAHVDVVSVLLDAGSAATYRALHRFDGYDRAVAGVEALIEAQKARGLTTPIIAPEMVKIRANLAEMEAFYDHWLRRTGAAVITGPAGRPELAVMDMAPPARSPCPRLWSRLLVLADGRVVLCDQDAAALHPIAHLEEGGICEIWTGPRMTDLRRAHAAGRYDSLPLCASCREWHRP